MINQNRLVWCDAIRLLAFFMLLCCHAADPFYAAAAYASSGASADPELVQWGGTMGVTCSSLCSLVCHVDRSTVFTCTKFHGILLQKAHPPCALSFLNMVSPLLLDPLVHRTIRYGKQHSVQTFQLGRKR